MYVARIAAVLGERARAAEAAGFEAPSRPVFDFGPSLQYDDWTVNEIIAGSLPVSVARTARASSSNRAKPLAPQGTGS